jgi:hypothetical protein
MSLIHASEFIAIGLEFHNSFDLLPVSINAHNLKDHRRLLGLRVQRRMPISFENPGGKKIPL